MITMYKTIHQIVDGGEYCPLPVGIIPNNMGINLASVDGVSWQKQDDNQLTSVTIYFIPGKEVNEPITEYTEKMGTVEPVSVDGDVNDTTLDFIRGAIKKYKDTVEPNELLEYIAERCK